jgi:hypothetical protein
MRLQVGEPAQGGAGVGLVREAEGRLVAAEAVVAVEQGGQPQAMDARPEIVGRVAGFGAAHRGGPTPVVDAIERGGRQRLARAADRFMGAGGSGRLHDATLVVLK